MKMIWQQERGTTSVDQEPSEVRGRAREEELTLLY